MQSIEIFGNITKIESKAFAYCRSLRYFFYIGTTVPLYEPDVFSDTFIRSIYVTPEYKSDSFCNLSVMLLPEQTSLISEIITISNQYDEIYQTTTIYDIIKSSFISEHSQFTESEKFTQSYLINSFEVKSSYYDQTNSNIFTYTEKESETYNEDTIFYSSQIKNSYSYSLSFILTFVQKRSVSFSISNSKSNSFYITYDKYKETFLIISTQNNYKYYFPYIIYFYSPLYISTNVIINIGPGKKLTGEQLIGITCGAASIFFIVLYIIIVIYRKNTYNIIDEESFYSISSSSEMHSNSFENSRQKNFDDNASIQNSDDDSNYDFWL